MLQYPAGKTQKKIINSNRDPNSTDKGSAGILWINNKTGNIFVYVSNEKEGNLWKPVRIDTKNPSEKSENIVHSNDYPTITENLPIGTFWVVDDKGELFICVDNTTDNNVWQGLAKSYKIAPTTVNVVDFFGDNSGVALYQLDGDANDTGGIHNGEEHRVTYPDIGVFSQSAKFKNGTMGLNTYNNGIHLDGTVARDKKVFTLSCWVKGKGIILQSDYYGDANGWATGWAIFTNKVDKTLSARKKKTVTYKRVPTDTFHHFCAVINHTDKAKIYIDGALVASGDISGDTYYNGRYYADTGENIGSAYNNGFKGLIDQVRVFNRALTTEEINQLYREQ